MTGVPVAAAPPKLVSELVPLPGPPDALSDLCTAMQLLEQSGDAAAQRLAAGLRAWLGDREAGALERALALPQRARRRWRDAQRAAILRLAAEANEPGADPWRQSVALAGRIQRRTRARARDSVAALLDRAAALGPLPGQAQVYRVLTRMPPVGVSAGRGKCSPMQPGATDRQQLEHQIARCDLAIDRLIAGEAALDGLTADLRPHYAAAREQIADARDQWSRDLAALDRAALLSTSDGGLGFPQAAYHNPDGVLDATCTDTVDKPAARSRTVLFASRPAARGEPPADVAFLPNDEEPS